MLESSPQPTLRDVADRAGVSVSTVTRVLTDSPLAGPASRRKVKAAVAELGYVEPASKFPSPTISDVAERAGVSVTTVSRALTDSGQVRGKTLERVRAAMAELDFVPNGHARALNRPGGGQVAVLSSSMLGPAFVGIAQGIETVVSARGHQFVVHTTGDEVNEAAHVETLRGQRAQAVVFIGGVDHDPSYPERMLDYVRSLSIVGTRVVLCGRPALPGAPEVASVDYDNAGGVREVTERLIALGHREIAFVGGRAGQSTRGARAQGYAQAMADAGLPERDVPTADWEIEDGVRAASELWEQHPVTAVVAVRDLVAVGVIRELRRRGVDVPREVSVVGFDDLPLTGDLSPALTTIRTPMEAIGRTVAELAIGHDLGGADLHQVLPVEVVLRDSAVSALQP